MKIEKIEKSPEGLGVHITIDGEIPFFFKKTYIIKNGVVDKALIKSEILKIMQDRSETISDAELNEVKKLEGKDI